HISKLICRRNYLRCDLQSYLGTTRQIASIGYSILCGGTLNNAPSRTTHISKLICRRNYLRCDLQSYLGTTRQIASIGYSVLCGGTLNNAPSRTTKMPSNNCAKPSIGTHNGKFHADELVACAMLKQLPEYADAEIVRSRDQSVLSNCTIVVDVGGVFDPITHRYDHHQRGFELTFKSFFKDSEWDIKLSSAGLVYVHFGPQILANVIGVQESDPMIPVLFNKIYGKFIVELDAIDNGIPMTEDSMKYTINTGLSARVGLLNPQWNHRGVDETVCFMKALFMVEKEFIKLVLHYAESWYPARKIVAKALKKRWQVDPSGHIFSLEQQPCPWAAHLHELEKLELKQKNMESVSWDVTDSSTISGRPVFCLYQRDDGHWSVQSVAVSETESFKNRVSLLESWRGLRDEELSKVVGLPGCIFVHANGFLGIHETREGALHMARASLKSSNFSG
ncbi:Metal-dependent protein hydrolase, partial [Paragonimus heterotremus]